MQMSFFILLLHVKAFQQPPFATGTKMKSLSGPLDLNPALAGSPAACPAVVPLASSVFHLPAPSLRPPGPVHMCFSACDAQPLSSVQVQGSLTLLCRSQPAVTSSGYPFWPSGINQIFPVMSSHGNNAHPPFRAFAIVSIWYLFVGYLINTCLSN